MKGQGSFSASPSSFANVNGELFFHANSSVYGRELWKSDGTEVGTMLVKDIEPLWPSPSLGTPKGVGDKAFFSATASAGRGLWVSDGTDAGTYRVRDLSPNEPYSYITDMVAVGDDLFVLYFRADGSRRLEL